MTAVGRLTLVSHAGTEAMSTARFPDDEPLNTVGLRQARAVAHLALRADTQQRCGPEQRTRQTAQIIGLHAQDDPALADLDCGRWRGQPLDTVPPEDLHCWLTEPSQAPHGGESIIDLIDRVTGWLSAMRQSRTVAVTHPAVIRAAMLIALDSPPQSFWRIDIAPASCTRLHYRGLNWTLKL